MKLTKLQRHTAYIIMLDGFEKGKYRWFCVSLNAFGFSMSEYAICKHLPELWKKKPKRLHTPNYWFMEHETAKRIELLKQCINETY